MTTKHFDRSRRILLKKALATPLAYGIGTQLVSEALGQPAARHCLISFVGGGLYPDHTDGTPESLIPLEFHAEFGMKNHNYQRNSVKLNKAGPFKLPRILSGFAPYQERLLIVANMYNGDGAGGEWQHYSGHGALGCSNFPNSQYGQNTPKQATFDQYVAQRVGQNTANESVLLQLGRGADAGPVRGTFAAGPQKSLPAIANTKDLFESLFSQLTKQPEQGGSVDLTRKAIFDSLRSDITDLGKVLAGTERQKMDDYLASIERVALRIEQRAQLRCDAPGDASHSDENMTALAALAIRCGVTNVVSMAQGNGLGHDDSGASDFGLPGEESYFHGAEYYKAAARYWERWSRLFAEMLKIVEGAPAPQGGSLLDATTFLMLSDVGGTHNNHHSDKISSGAPRYHAVVIGNKKLKTNQFVHYPYKQTFAASLYSTIGESMGAGGFKGGATGPTTVLSELLA